jgi:DNA-binding CsgD family transcriptional regulator
MREIAARGDGLSLDRAGRPLPASHEGRASLSALLAEVRSGGHEGAMTIPRKSSADAYSVLVVPSPSPLAEAAWNRSLPPASVMLVHDPDGRIVNPDEVLRASLGLTPGAAKLVAALANNLNLRSFADREGITIHTARYHLRTALARTGARSQVDLVSLAVRHLRDLGVRAPTPLPGGD